LTGKIYDHVMGLRSKVEALVGVTRHESARYEGDGDPGCAGSCQACILEGLAGKVRAIMGELGNTLPPSGDPDVDSMLSRCLETFRTKGEEYTAGSPDRLANFRAVGQAVVIPPEKAWFTYFYKHYSALVSYILNGETKSNETIDSRIMDMIVYLLLFDKMVKEKTKALRELVDSATATRMRLEIQKEKAF
jgi:hypothetical protein